MVRLSPGVRRGALALVAALLLVLASNAPAVAQFGPVTPPARVFGSVTIDGRPAAGATVAAFIGPRICGSTVTAADGRYQVDVRSAATQFGCGTDGALVTFTVNGRPAQETVIFRSGAFIQRNLTVGVFVAEVTVERWAPFAQEPCTAPIDSWCIQIFRLPHAPEPFAFYRMLAFLRDGRETQPTDWILVVPNAETRTVASRHERGVERVRWERWTPRGAVPCAGRIAGDWCVEGVDVPPPRVGTVWYRMMVRHPDGRVESPTGFIPASPPAPAPPPTPAPPPVLRLPAVFCDGRWIQPASVHEWVELRLLCNRRVA